LHLLTSLGILYESFQFISTRISARTVSNGVGLDIERLFRRILCLALVVPNINYVRYVDIKFLHRYLLILMYLFGLYQF